MSSDQEISGLRRELNNAKFWLFFTGVVSLVSLGLFTYFAVVQNGEIQEVGLLASGIFTLWFLTGLATLLVMQHKEKKLLRKLEYEHERGYD